MTQGLWQSCFPYGSHTFLVFLLLEPWGGLRDRLQGLVNKAVSGVPQRSQTACGPLPVPAVWCCLIWPCAVLGQLGLLLCTLHRL